MKFRKSFVTNSSSSSYICDYCGEEASGWDMMLSEAEMVECVNGHTICERHIDEDEFEKMIEKFEDEDSEDFNEDWRYELPEKYCPICNFEVFLDNDVLKFLEKFHSINMNDIKNEIKKNFKNYSDFKEKIGS